jgi:HEXXH motif-containing protein
MRLRYRLDAVERLLGHVPDLARIVAASVVAIYPLVAKPGYDVSHSQPRWPNLIFVSFPEREDCIGDLRLAESVVHEAMHLHLTTEEGHSPLVAHHENSLYSPWMDTSRSVQGVLHGLFVFRCISAFLRRLAGSTALPNDANKHVATRLDEIQQQLAEVDSFALEQSLTPRGVDLLRYWAASAL